MTDFWIIFFAVFIFVSSFDYMYVNVGDYFVDHDRVAYQVVEKNLFFVRLANDSDQKVIPILVLCMSYMRVDM